MKKWFFYLLSMTFFLIIVIILGFKMPESWTDCYSQPGICASIICAFLLVCTSFFWLFLTIKVKGTQLGPITISKVDSINYDIMSFFASYCFPLVSFSVCESWRHVGILGILFVLIGIIYVTANFYYCNPTLLILGFRVYHITGTIAGAGVINKIVIARSDISIGDQLKYIPIDNTTYYAIKL